MLGRFCYQLFFLQGFGRNPICYLCFMLDYIVVGLGLSGTAFCETLRQGNKSFVVFEDESQTSSRVAGGLSNPVILKRFTLAWNAPLLFPVANAFYTKVASVLQQGLLMDLPVYRKFASVEEQNLWFEAADKTSLTNYLSPIVVRNTNPWLKAPFNFGRVMHAKRLDTVQYLESYKELLKETDILISESFLYHRLEDKKTHVVYNGIKARQIVFAEGFGLRQNPFFNYLPMQGSKGEYLTIRTAHLQEENAIKGAYFVIPLGHHLYKVGANYDHNTVSSQPTEEAKKEILRKLDGLLSCPYEVVGHEAGIRPTVKDRKPLVGRHPIFENLYVLNGYGSHGVMIAPWAAQQLYDYIAHGKPISPEIDAKRYNGAYK